MVTMVYSRYVYLSSANTGYERVHLLPENAQNQLTYKVLKTGFRFETGFGFKGTSLALVCKAGNQIGSHLLPSLYGRHTCFQTSLNVPRAVTSLRPLRRVQSLLFIY